MGLLSRFVNGPQQEERDLTNWATNDEGFFGGGTNAGVPVNERNALTYSTVYKCVRLLSSTVASLPCDVFTKQNGWPQEVASPAWLIKPNKEQNRFEFMEQVMASLTIWGNAYLATIRDARGMVTELWVLDPSQVTVRRNATTHEIEYVVRNKPYSGYDVLHIRGFTLAGSLTGMSPITAAREAIAAGMATDQYAAKFWANGANPAGLIELPGDADDEWVTRTKKSWHEAHGGSGNAHKVAILTSGAKFNTMALPQDDAQFIETRLFQVNEIATRIFDIPAHMVGDNTKATFSNIEHQGLEFVTYTLRQWLTRIEAALNVLLLPGQELKFNEHSLLRGDSKAQAEYLKVAVESGQMTVNEARRKLDLPPVEGGDVLYLPLNNLSPIGGKQLTDLDRVNMVGALIRAGFDPTEAAAAYDLPTIKHSGTIPLTVYNSVTVDTLDEKAAQELEKGDTQIQQATQDNAA